MPIASLAITQANLVPGSNNSTYSYKFPISARFRDGDEVALSSANLFYSWFNISVDNNNNSFSYLWPTGSGTVTVDVNIPNGFYTAEDLNAYLQSVMVANSHYLIDGDGNYLYYLQLTTNSTLYALQLNTWVVPTSLPSGYTAPGGFPAYPSTARTPQFVIPATDFRNIIGFDAGTYPSTPQLTSYSATSTFTPQITPVSSFNILCSLLNNSLSRPVNLLFNAAPNTTFGSQITVQQQFPIFQPIQPGTYNDIIIKFTDQNFNALPLQDSNISVILLVKTR
jgi:hypothetical protein